LSVDFKTLGMMIRSWRRRHSWTPLSNGWKTQASDLQSHVGEEVGLGGNMFHRDREVGHNRLFRDYFSDNPTYDSVKFHRRFRMRRELFLSIVDHVCAYDQWFVQRPDAVGRMGLSSLQKCTAALCMLAYGVAADATDEYVRLGASTAHEALHRFCIAIRGCFESTFLRQPSWEDLEK
jgi:hypothetical protein